MNSTPNYFLREDGTFVIENYNCAPAFSSFFPGIAGLKGIPMWAFYVNRGQGIASFGIKNKNYSIMEFYPANTSYTLVSTFGFRTFLKIKRGDKVTNYEAFAVNPCYDVKQTMYITSCDMAIEEINETLGIKTTVRYATLPNEPIAAIIRAVTVENISTENIEIEIADGMPKLIPYYVNQWAQKFMSTTIQAWTTVDNFEKTGNPFFRLKVDTADSAEVVEINEGNFYFGYLSNGKNIKKADIVINPDVLFGSDLSFGYPKEFFSYDKNFNYPFTAKGVADFWKRWFITIGDWMRDYVFLPIYEKFPTPTGYILTFVLVWVLIGIWFGSTMNFLIWGLYHLVLLLLHEYVFGDSFRGIPSIVQHILTFIFITIGWVFFAFSNLGDGLTFLQVMFGGGARGVINSGTFYLISSNWLFIFLAILASSHRGYQLLQNICHAFIRLRIRRVMVCVIYIVIFLMSLAYYISTPFDPFALFML